MIARGSINLGGQPDSGGQGRVFDRHVTEHVGTRTVTCYSRPPTRLHHNDGTCQSILLLRWSRHP